MLSVAIIDPSAISRNLLSTVLVSGGYDVVADANSSSASLARIVKLNPNIICVDTGAPGTAEGVALLESIRASLPKTLIFMVSGKMNSESVQSALERGVHGFIVKPFNSVTVLGTIRNTVIKIAKQQRASQL